MLTDQRHGLDIVSRAAKHEMRSQRTNVEAERDPGKGKIKHIATTKLGAVR